MRKYLLLIIVYIAAIIVTGYIVITFRDNLDYSSALLLAPSMTVVAIWIYTFILAFRIKNLNNLWFPFLFSFGTIAVPMFLWRLYKGRYFLS